MCESEGAHSPTFLECRTVKYINRAKDSNLNLVVLFLSVS